MTNVITNSGFWPDGIRLVISVSMQFEAGGQPPKGTDSPFPKGDFPESVSSDAAANTWFAYGYREGIPRMLDLWDRHGVKVASHMIGEAAQRHQDLARAPSLLREGRQAASNAAFRAARANRRVGWTAAVRDWCILSAPARTRYDG